MIDELDEEILNEREMRRTMHFHKQRQQYETLQEDSPLTFEDQYQDMEEPNVDD